MRLIKVGVLIDGLYVGLFFMGRFGRVGATCKVPWLLLGCFPLMVI